MQHRTERAEQRQANTTVQWRRSAARQREAPSACRVARWRRQEPKQQPTQTDPHKTKTPRPPCNRPPHQGEGGGEQKWSKRTKYSGRNSVAVEMRANAEAKAGNQGANQPNQHQTNNPNHAKNATPKRPKNSCLRRRGRCPERATLGSVGSLRSIPPGNLFCGQNELRAQCKK